MSDDEEQSQEKKSAPKPPSSSGRHVMRLEKKYYGSPDHDHAFKRLKREIRRKIEPGREVERSRREVEKRSSDEDGDE